MFSSSSRLRFPQALLTLCLLLGFGALSSWAQVTQGSISVSVTDASGAILPSADLQLTDLATNESRVATTSSAGSYTFAGLPTGNYKITITKQGFEAQVFESVTVSATRVTDLKATLKVGAVTEQVVVSSEAVPVLDTDSNAITGTFDMKQVEDLPLVGRDISSLSQLVPGYAGGTWNGMPYMATGNNVDGVVGTTQRMKFDGAATPLVEARVENMEEMTVQTDQLNMNTGYGISDMQVNFVTRRGTNNFHGRIYEDFRNAALNANTWLNDATGSPKPQLIRNEFGASLGGAIVKNKLFFFGTFAMAKQPSGAVNTNTVMSPTAQTGLFTFTGTTGTQHTVNLLTAIAGSPAGQAVNPCCAMPTVVNPNIATIFSQIDGGIAKGAVTPNSDANLVDVAWNYPTPLTAYFPTVRLDYNMRENLRLYLSFNMTEMNQANGDVPPLPGSFFAKYGGTNHSKYFTQALGLDWSITPRLLNSFHAGYLYNSNTYGYDLTPAWLTQPSINFAYGASGLELNNLPIGTYYPVFNASDNVTWQKAAHTVTFGFSFFREQDHYYNAPAGFQFAYMGIDPNDPAAGVFTNYFNSNYPDASAADLLHAENMYATLVGRINSVNPNGAGFPLDPKTKQYENHVGAYFLDELQHNTGLFIQDSWKTTRHLTINAGLRWDFNSPSKDLTVGYHSADNVGIYGPSGVGNLFHPGVLTSDPNGLNPVYRTRDSVYNGWYVTPQPMLGISWNPSKSEGFLGSLLGDGSSVIRAGFSLRRMTEPYQFFWNSASNEGYAFYQSFRLSPQVPGSTLPPTGGFYAGSYALGDPQPAPFFVSPPTYQQTIPESQETFFGYWSGVNGMNQNLHQPYLMSWNFGIQRALGPSNVLEVRYLGNRSVHQWIVTNPNEVNIFENGFLSEFKQAQKNLAINAANGHAGSFAYNSLPGQAPLPIMTAAAGPGAANLTSFMTNGAFITDLNNGAAGDFASILAGSSTYLCNLVGGANFSPCAGNAGAGYPINFFQANPYNAGKATGYQNDIGYGDYHSLQIDFRQKAWRGMQFDVNYAWSHALGVQPNNSWTGAFNMFTMRDPRLSYGPTGFDYRHVVHANGTYDLPFGKGKPFASGGGVADKVVGGWSIGTIANWQTGGPYQLLGGFATFNGPYYTPVGDTYGDGGINLNGMSLASAEASTVRHVPGATFANTINPSFKAAISPNTNPGTFGAHPWLYGPHTFSQDLAITKSFLIRENLRFVFQSEFINVWNHPVWANPAGGYNSTSQGFIQNTSAPIQSATFGESRVVQANPGQAGLGARQVEFRANIEF